MAKNDFKDLKGLPPEALPYKPKKPPKKLDEVPMPKRKEPKFNWKDWLRIMWMYFLDHTDGKLNPAERALAGKYWCYITIAGFVIVGTLLLLLILR